MKELLAKHPDYLIHGHSHIAADCRVGSTRRICPGALNRAESLTVALFDTESEEVRILRLSDEATAKGGGPESPLAS
jgi:predicted phosphodiesterase